ncbi:hypothetical protein Anas_09819 [Armadillidium nasatum]|uniref:Uncharacterized protein n=1 Tax=Armadillidium nasatum TaxID=96803 RepID=A0A5N5T9S3_9CRUS|nr:hypothetical protein Anas_09819 [Armadillidium nasatum]
MEDGLKFMCDKETSNTLTDFSASGCISYHLGSFYPVGIPLITLVHYLLFVIIARVYNRYRRAD